MNDESTPSKETNLEDFKTEDELQEDIDILERQSQLIKAREILEGDAKERETACQKEIIEVLKKYNCTIRFPQPGMKVVAL